MESCVDINDICDIDNTADDSGFPDQPINQK